MEFAWSDKHKLYAPSVMAQSAFTLTAGRTTRAALNALTPALPVFWLGSGDNPGRLKKWAHLIPFGEGADNSTFDYRLWLVFAEHSENDHLDSLHLVLAGSGSITLCATLGASGGLVGAGQRYADAITWATATESTTPKGEGERLWAGRGAMEPTVYSPGGDLRCGLTIGDTGRADGLIFETDLTGATGANALIAAGT